MTIDELIERLEEYRDALGGDAEVHLMTQQNWPFENRIAGVCSDEEINNYDPEEEDEAEDGVHAVAETFGVVYIVEGDQIGYGNKRAWEIAT